MNLNKNLKEILNLNLNLNLNSTVLDDYISFYDPNFDYDLVTTRSGIGYVYYQYNYTSLQYLNASQVDRPIWHHQLTIIIPNVIQTDVAFMLSDYGDNTGSFTAPSSAATQVAVSMGAIVGELRQVPNQPLCFTQPLPGTGDPDGGCLDEDWLMSYGMEWFHRGGGVDPLLLARLGMVKSSVYANTILENVAMEIASVDISGFFIYGASKRGATVWLVAAIDDRVIGVCPIVIDSANMVEMVHRRYMALGPRVFNEFNMYSRNMGWIDTPEGHAFNVIDDPYYYFGRLENKFKLFQFAASDAYFEPEVSRWWWNDLPGSKHIRYTPMFHYDFYLRYNSEIVGNMCVWAKYILANRQLPTIQWNVTEGSRTITSWVGTSGTPPSSVRLFYLNNPERKTFSPAHGAPIDWQSTPLEANADGYYIAAMPAPPQGWTGFFIQFEFPTGFEGEDETHFKVSTLVSVVPDTWPFELVEEYFNCGAPENCNWPQISKQ